MIPKRIPVEIKIGRHQEGWRRAVAKCPCCNRESATEWKKTERSSLVIEALRGIRNTCPNFVSQVYYEKVIPDGLTLWVNTLGEFYKLWMTGKTACSDFSEIRAGEQTATWIYVVNDGSCLEAVERKFVRYLARIGYRSKVCQKDLSDPNPVTWTMSLERDLRDKEKAARKLLREDRKRAAANLTRLQKAEREKKAKKAKKAKSKKSTITHR
jgi:hypothetical protein